jgi:hypothetical protein
MVFEVASLLFYGRMSFSILVSVMEKLTVLEALVPIYQSAWHYICEDQNFHEHHCYLPIVIKKGEVDGACCTDKRDEKRIQYFR